MTFSTEAKYWTLFEKLDLVLLVAKFTIYKNLRENYWKGSKTETRRHRLFLAYYHQSNFNTDAHTWWKYVWKHASRIIWIYTFVCASDFHSSQHISTQSTLQTTKQNHSNTSDADQWGSAACANTSNIYQTEWNSYRLMGYRSAETDNVQQTDIHRTQHGKSKAAR